MRRKPVTRSEVRFDGRKITTLPFDSVRERKPDDYYRAPTLEAIPKLWAPLLRSLPRAEAEPITAPVPYWQGDPRECRKCGKRFYYVFGGHFCSDLCAEAHRLAALVKARSEARAAARADRQCETCGKPIKAQRSTMRFCSVRCRVAAHRKG